ncbi:MAG: hypothetical protein M5R36_21840 [Deltaproteobacteria bacterium]|nr:hypothetical protein [Deltaproteobacteria bacterium]
MHFVRRVKLDDHLIKVNHLSHFIMLATATLLPYFFYLEVNRRPDYRDVEWPGRSRWLSRLDIVGLTIVVATVWGGLTFAARQGS